MKKLYALLMVLTVTLASLLCKAERPTYVENKALAATGAIFTTNGRFHCSGTEIGKDKQGNGYFLTARHCVADPDTDHVTDKLLVSFAPNQMGPFYLAYPVAIGLYDDVALLKIVNGASLPEVKIYSEYGLKNGDPIFNASYPMGAGKLLFHGEFTSRRFPAIPGEFSDYPQWSNAMPVNLTFAHGSSGSGIYSISKGGLIGVAVGTFGEGSFNIVEPGSIVLYFLKHLPENSVENYMKVHPEHESTNWFFYDI